VITQQKKSATNNKAKGLVTKWQIIKNNFKNQFLIKDHHAGRQLHKK
jgi:hypothetical protein